MIIVKLTRGFESLIDEIDADLAADYNWYEHKGYAIRNWQISDGLPRRTMRLHKIILERKLGRSLVEGEIPDHGNRNRSDNRRENLQVVTSSGNRKNAKLHGSHSQYSRTDKIRKNNTSGYAGVSKNHGRWTSSTMIKGVRYRLGNFDTAEKAYEAYLRSIPSEDV
jgi:hypothetical protein